MTGALTTLARRASERFARAERRTPDVPARPRSQSTPAPARRGREARGYRPQSAPRPPFVWRSDTRRHPDEVFRDGFSARRPTGEGYSYDLARHQRGGNGEADNPTGFISTTADHRVTDQWGQPVIRDGAPVTARDADGNHWQLRTNTVYEIKNSDHFVDARAQDASHRYPRMDDQHEFAAPHRIEPQNIRSAVTTERWERPVNDGVQSWPHHIGPDGRTVSQPVLHDNSGFDPTARPYNPDTDPDSGW